MANFIITQFSKLVTDDTDIPETIMYYAKDVFGPKLLERKFCNDIQLFNDYEEARAKMSNGEGKEGDCQRFEVAKENFMNSALATTVFEKFLFLVKVDRKFLDTKKNLNHNCFFGDEKHDISAFEDEDGLKEELFDNISEYLDMDDIYYSEDELLDTSKEIILERKNDSDFKIYGKDMCKEVEKRIVEQHKANKIKLRTQKTFIQRVDKYIGFLYEKCNNEDWFLCHAASMLGLLDKKELEEWDHDELLKEIFKISDGFVIWDEGKSDEGIYYVGNAYNEIIRKIMDDYEVDACGSTLMKCIEENTKNDDNGVATLAQCIDECIEKEKEIVVEKYIIKPHPKEKTFSEMLESAGISQKKIADRLGVSTTTIRNWIKEDSQVPTLAKEWISKIDHAVNDKIS